MVRPCSVPLGAGLRRAEVKTQGSINHQLSSTLRSTATEDGQLSTALRLCVKPKKKQLEWPRKNTARQSRNQRKGARHSCRFTPAMPHAFRNSCCPVIRTVKRNEFRAPEFHRSLRTISTIAVQSTQRDAEKHREEILCESLRFSASSALNNLHGF